MGNRVVGTARRLVRWDYKMDPRIAWLSPMPPAPTGIASYSTAVLDGLERIGYTPGKHTIEPIWPVRPRHEGQIPWYTMGIYHVGNNVGFHRDIYRHAIQTPGLVVIHDLALDDFVRGMIAAGDPLGHQALREGLASAPQLEAIDVDEPLRIPYVAHVARRARGILVHSPFVERCLRAFGCRTPVYVAPHPVVERWDAIEAARGQRGATRAPLEARGMRTLVGVFGDLTSSKLIDLVLADMKTLDSSVHVALVGRRIEAHDVDAWVRGSGLGERVMLHTDVADEEFLRWMVAADIAVDLRSPHRGEVSGSLARAMQVGLPTLVSDTGTYRDLSDELVVKVPAGRPEPAEIANALRTLIERPDRARAIGQAARAHVQELDRSERTAHVYAEAIEGTLLLLADPTRRALSRWAGALADLGITEEDLRAGYGAGYARALDEFAPAADDR
jgi:glycosyltransferase involved in cell wall biosynthesis